MYFLGDNKNNEEGRPFHIHNSSGNNSYLSFCFAQIWVLQSSEFILCWDCIDKYLQTNYNNIIQTSSNISVTLLVAVGQSKILSWNHTLTMFSHGKIVLIMNIRKLHFGMLLYSFSCLFTSQIVIAIKASITLRLVL